MMLELISRGIQIIQLVIVRATLLTVPDLSTAFIKASAAIAVTKYDALFFLKGSRFAIEIKHCTGPLSMIY